MRIFTTHKATTPEPATASSTLQGTGSIKTVSYTWEATKDRGMTSPYPYTLIITIEGGTYREIAGNERDCISTSRSVARRFALNKSLPITLSGEGLT